MTETALPMKCRKSVFQVPANVHYNTEHVQNPKASNAFARVHHARFTTFNTIKPPLVLESRFVRHRRVKIDRLSSTSSWFSLVLVQQDPYFITNYTVLKSVNKSQFLERSRNLSICKTCFDVSHLRHFPIGQKNVAKFVKA